MNRRVLVALFAVYLFLMVWLVLFKFHLPLIGRPDEREIKLIPFVAVGKFGASAIWEVFANLVLFVPFGAYLRALAPKWPLWRIAVVLAASSLALEVAEYVLAVGSSDVTDVIVNTAGGLVGVGLFALVRRRFGPRTTTAVNVIGAVVTLVVIVIVGIDFVELLTLPPRPPGVIIIK